MQSFLVVGQTGVGKSSFINATFSRKIAHVAEFEACTKIVQHYAYNTSYGDICLIDTPGLGEENRLLDTQYLRLIRKSVKLDKVDTILYVTPLDETRFRSTEQETLRLLTKELGPEIWRNSWLILTFAASIKADRVNMASKIRHEHIHYYLLDITNSIFLGFRKVLLVDNTIQNWTPGIVPIAQALNGGKQE